MVTQDEIGAMTGLGERERLTQDRVIALFQERIGWRYLGDWSERANSNIEDVLLATNLKARGYSEAQVSAAVERIRQEGSRNRSTSLSTRIWSRSLATSMMSDEIGDILKLIQDDQLQFAAQGLRDMSDQFVTRPATEEEVRRHREG